jgi:serine/threonine protein kinase
VKVDSVEGWENRGELGRPSVSPDFAICAARDLARNLMRAVKTALTPDAIESLNRESAIHADLNHPLILGFEDFIPATSPATTTLTAKGSAAIVTEFAENGSLADHLSRGSRGRLLSATRVAKIAVGIVMGMRYLHSEGVIHGDLRPATVFVDWNWTVRVGGFCRSVLASRPGDFESSKLSDVRYAAPECFENCPTRRSDVFSFGLILVGLVGGDPDFWGGLSPFQVMKRVFLDGDRPVIPSGVEPSIRTLIEDCCGQSPLDRLPFEMILDRLKAIDFKVTAGVKSEKVREFVESVEKWERAHGLEINEFG